MWRTLSCQDFGYFIVCNYLRCIVLYCILYRIESNFIELSITNFEGAVFDSYKEGISVHPEIMFPLVCSDHEIEIIAPVVKVRAYSFMPLCTSSLSIFITLYFYLFISPSSLFSVCVHIQSECRCNC